MRYDIKTHTPLFRHCLLTSPSPPPLSNNEIATLQKNLEQCAVETLGAQNNVDSSIRNMSDKVLQLGQILASIEVRTRLTNKVTNNPELTPC